ncbi:MAG: hypothetical protein OSB45_12780, partial [Pseudomonadales bacterium]|nr:hypothetical protein [Pseudomonadales bacterium]
LLSAICLAQPDPVASAPAAPVDLQPGLGNIETDLILTRSRTLVSLGKRREAIELLVPVATKNPQNRAVEEQLVVLLLDDNRLAQAEKVVLGSSSAEVVLAPLREKIESKLQRLLFSDKLVTVVVQKRMDLHDFDTVILILDRALTVFPNKKADFFTLKGEALYKQNHLELAEEEFRKALNINPLNPVAKGYVTEIRTTLEAQTSTALAEWISIAKDKLGDFIVTFLALFTAFAVNSLIAPIALRIRLMQARRSFEMGDYDDFADLLETLLDKEDFKPLRQNFRALLRSGDYHDIRSIFEKHVMTLERLPTLLRILEREHEKLSG